MISFIKKKEKCRKYVELQENYKSFHVTRAKKEEEKEGGKILCYDFLSPMGKLKYKLREFIKRVQKIIKMLGQIICTIMDFFTYPLRYVYTKQLLEGKWDVKEEQKTGKKGLCRLYPVDILEVYKDALEHRIDFFQRWNLDHWLPYIPDKLYVEEME